MNLRKTKNTIFILFEIMLLSGCTVTYNLDISSNNFYESLNIYSSPIDGSNYYIPAYYNSISFDEYDVDVNQKIEGVIYYNNTFDSNKINFEHKFTDTDFFKSNIANSFYSGIVLKKYDHDDNGEEDYYILSTTDDFSAFDLYDQLTEVTIKIKNNYEVISTNAEEIDGNIYTWHLTPDNISSINMVYNPDKTVDYRTLWEKIKEGEYTNIFTISILIALIGIIIYLLIKRKGDTRNKI